MEVQSAPAQLELIRPEEAAQILEVSKATLANWRRRRIGPAFVKFPRGVRYRLPDLRKWLDVQTENKADDNGNDD